jgi:hypothetical protein
MRAMIEGFLTGNFRQWGATQYSQYQRSLGQSQYCGIELEFITEPSADVKVMMVERNIKFVHNVECIYLFDVSNPRKFRKELIEVWTFLLKNVPVSGSVHFNHQVLMSNYDARSKRNVSYYTREDIYNPNNIVACRLENKKGVGTLNWEDMFLQMLISYRERFGETKIKIPEFNYPKSRQLTRFIPKHRL